MHLLDQLYDNQPELVNKKNLFIKIMRLSLKSVLSKIHELDFELLPYAPNLPCLAPSDYNLFPNMNKFPAGKKYSSYFKVIAATKAYFKKLGGSA